MQYEFIKKDDDVIETEEMKFQKFTKAMEMVVEKANPDFNILIDRTIEIGIMEVNSTDETESEKL